MPRRSCIRPARSLPCASRRCACRSRCVRVKSSVSCSHSASSPSVAVSITSAATTTVVRTANALGMDAVVLTGACADLYSPKTVRAAMGALFRQPVLTCTTDELLQLLHARGLKLYGAALTDAAQDLRRVPLSPAAVAIGSEGRGLSAQLLAQCDGQIIIPMQPGAESLNAAVAAAVVMWEIARTGM